MNRKKLSRRETMLIRHALNRYQKTEVLTIYFGKHQFMKLSLYQIRAYNIMVGRPRALALYYGPGTQIVLE